jgi:hypothetical protein
LLFAQSACVCSGGPDQGTISGASVTVGGKFSLCAKLDCHLPQLDGISTYAGLLTIKPTLIHAQSTFL